MAQRGAYVLYCIRYPNIRRAAIPAHLKTASVDVIPQPKPRKPEHEFLVFMGKRVREVRNRRGMTRKMVAHEADVSERHLAQLETGEGNISIVLLRRIAQALSISLAELFGPEKAE